MQIVTAIKIRLVSYLADWLGWLTSSVAAAFQSPLSQNDIIDWDFVKFTKYFTFATVFIVTNSNNINNLDSFSFAQ